MSQIKEPIPGEIYKHFKNKLYQIITIAIHSETKEKLVIYQALYGSFKTYARPLDMFISEVDHNKYPDVIQKYRFELCVAEDENINKEEIETIPDNQKSVDNKGSDDYLIKFLDADSFQDKRMIFEDMKKIMNTKLIYDIATALDIVVEEADVETQYKSILNCLDTMVKFECNRLR